MRDQIEHWRRRALTAEQANTQAGAYVEQERQQANAIAVASSRVVYMAGSDAGGLRLRLEDLGRMWGSWRTRFLSLFRSVKGDLERIDHALSGKAGTEIAAERERAKVKTTALAAFADEVRACLDLVAYEREKALEGDAEDSDLEAYRDAEESFRVNIRKALDAAAEAVGVNLAGDLEKDEQPADLEKEPALEVVKGDEAVH